MIRIKTIEAKNFKSVGNSGIKIEFNKNREMILLDGKVGSGKSMLLSIITYCWFGKDYASETKINELINRKNKKGLYTSITFTKDGEKGLYEVSRGIKPKLFSVLKDGKEIIDEATPTFLQTYLENTILGCSYNIFSQFFINDKFKNFMSLTKAERRKYMEDMISYLVIFTDMNKKINIKKAEINTNILGFEREIDKLVAKSETLQSTNINNINEIKENLLNIHEKIKVLNEDIQKIDIDEIKNFIKDYDEKISEYSNKERKLISNKAKKEAIISNYEKNKKKENDNIICPNCKTEISITDYFNDVNIDEEKERIDKIDIVMTKLSKSILKLKNEKEKYTKTSYEYKDKKSNLDIYKESEDRMKKKLDKDIEGVSEKIKQIEEEIIKLEENKSVLYIEIGYMETIQKMLADDGLRKYIIKTILPYVNKKIKYYLESFDLHYIFRFDDDFEVYISDGQNEFSFGAFSSGQQTKINLSILFAFYYFIRIKSLFNMDLQFFDEVMDRSLDPESTEMLFDILSDDKLFYDKHIIVITHKENIKSYGFDRIIKADITSGFTKYIENKEV